MEQQKKTFAVKLKGLAPWISQVQYEKEETDLTLYFTLNKDTEINVILEDTKAGSKLLPLVTPSLAPLAKRLILNIEYKPNSDLYITSLQRKDFIECRATSLALKGSMEELKQYGAQESSFLVLYETDRGTHGLLWSKRQDIREKVQSQNQGAQKGNWVLFTTQSTLPSLKEHFKTKL